MESCKHCKCQFEVTDKDREFYKKFDVPVPELCPSCRQKRRLAFYNRRKLYKRMCDFTGKPMISIFSPDKPFKVYDKNIWYSDKWDPLQYGRGFDFTRPFFDQFKDLMMDVPWLSLVLIGNNDNSDFNNDDMDLRNCYLVFDGTKGQDCYYGESFYDLQNCMDFLYLEYCQLCYECVSCHKCYNLKFSSYCKNCSDSWFLKDCIGCRNCAMCTNLHQKEYCIMNKQYSKKEYEDFMKNFDSGSFEMLKETIHKAKEYHLTQPVKAMHGVQNENVIGDNLSFCKNAFYCFDSNYLQDCEFCQGSQTGAKDSYDIDVWGERMELCYNCCESGTNVMNVVCSWGVSEGASNVYHSMFCSRGIQDLFGCIGIRHKSYCILNKQYAKEEYTKLVPRIIEHMKKTGEWGQFFPESLSPFCYNESLAQLYYPLTKEGILKEGYKWMDEKFEYHIPEKKYKIPDNIKDVKKDICNTVLVCESSGRPYKIMPAELNFYKKTKLPIPLKCPEQRHKERMKMRNIHRLWDRNCAKCNKAIKTSYEPHRPEIVYCEDCYNKEFLK